MTYIKFLERFGILFSLYTLWSIIFYYFADRTQKIWSDLGILEAFVYLVALTIGGYLQFFVCLLIFFCLFYLRKIKKIKLDNVVFMLWGKFAEKKAARVDSRKHLVLKSPHPSGLSASRGFFGCKHFSKANTYLADRGRDEIDWSLE